MDATQPVEVQQRALREMIRPHLVDVASAPPTETTPAPEAR
jgi:hypothetical protein